MLLSPFITSQINAKVLEMAYFTSDYTWAMVGQKLVTFGLQETFVLPVTF